jgi:transcription elongation factor GreA
MAVNMMTREGLEEKKERLEYLKTVQRPEDAARLKEARSYGDLSENAEYDAAKDAQAKTEAEISELEELLNTAVVEEDESNGDEVAFGCTVTLHDMVYDEDVTYKIVGDSEADLFNGKISQESLVGQNIMDRHVGDVVEFEVPDGTAKYKIIDIGN